MFVSSALRLKKQLSVLLEFEYKVSKNMLLKETVRENLKKNFWRFLLKNANQKLFIVLTGWK